MVTRDRVTFRFRSFAHPDSLSPCLCPGSYLVPDLFSLRTDHPRRYKRVVVLYGVFSVHRTETQTYNLSSLASVPLV